jgi:membrane-bound serine protease (ClpP class)
MLATLLSLWFAVNAVVIEVHGTVDEALSHHVKRSLEIAKQSNPRAIILDVDTWGGELEAAFEISDAITNVTQCSTVAYVRRKAISAGALIGLSANALYMAPGATMGDCAPIIATAEGPKFLGEKIESPLRARFRALAKRHNLPVLLAEKMVTKDLEVVETRDSAGVRTYYSSKNFGELVGEARQKFDSWKIVVPDGQLLTVDDQEALDLGFSRGTYATIDSMIQDRGWSLAATLEPTWSAVFAAWLSSLSPLLFMIGLALIWIEYKSPGGLVFGVAGFIVLGIALASKYLLGLSDHLPLLLAALGMLLFLIEVWFLPGAMIPAALGVLCLLGALTMSLQGFTFPDITNPNQVSTSLTSLGIVIISLVVGLLVSIAFLRFGLVRLTGRDGMHLKVSLDAGSPVVCRDDLVGLQGISVGTLRPRGRVDVDGVTIEGHCISGFLPDGAPVRLLRKNGTSWDVEAI